MEIRQHPTTGLLCREDGAVLIPASGTHKEHWTFGSKDKCSGYMRVQFRRKNYLVHRLIAESFLSNPLNLPEVDHYPDRNPLNNRTNNLRFADRKMQNNNRQICENSLEKYGVRTVEESMPTCERFVPRTRIMQNGIVP